MEEIEDQNLLPKSCPISKPLQCSKQLLKVKIIQSSAIGSGVWGHTTADIKFGEIKFLKKHKKFMLRILKDHFMKIPPAN